MGYCNFYCILVDKKMGYVYWGDVGFDVRLVDENRGFVGYDEVGQVWKVGNFGWFYFVGNNKVYYKYDFVMEVVLEFWDVVKFINNLFNNMGFMELLFV